MFLSHLLLHLHRISLTVSVLVLHSNVHHSGWDRTFHSRSAN